MLKDWKNAGASKIAQRWDNKKVDSHITIFARNPIYPNGSGIADTTISAWTTSIMKDNDLIISKTFSTKSQALAYAMSYMRTH